MPKNTFFNINQDKRDKIIEVAIDEFKKQHYERASINKIIKKADIAKGSFYQYFKNKKDLFGFIIDLIRKEKMAYITDKIRNPKKYSFFDVLYDMNEIALTFAAEHPDLQAISNKLTQDRDHKIYKEILSKNREVSLSEYRNLIKLGIERKELSNEINIHVVAHLIYSLNREIVAFYLDNPTFNKKQILNDYLYTIKEGIGI
ncbi:MAG: TetR/AcrR family transcriptional regulator [Clostridia bacterium]